MLARLHDQARELASRDMPDFDDVKTLALVVANTLAHLRDVGGAQRLATPDVGAPLPTMPAELRKRAEEMRSEVGRLTADLRDANGWRDKLADKVIEHEATIARLQAELAQTIEERQREIASNVAEERESLGKLREELAEWKADAKVDMANAAAKEHEAIAALFVDNENANYRGSEVRRRIATRARPRCLRCAGRGSVPFATDPSWTEMRACPSCDGSGRKPMNVEVTHAPETVAVANGKPADTQEPSPAAVVPGSSSAGEAVKVERHGGMWDVMVCGRWCGSLHRRESAEGNASELRERISALLAAEYRKGLHVAANECRTQGKRVVVDTRFEDGQRDASLALADRIEALASAAGGGK